MSGMGVPGDSGAWLMRRSDNRVMGLIWGRNHNQGDPSSRARLAYFTPMVDILAEIRDHAGGAAVSLLGGSASTGSSARATRSRAAPERVARSMSGDPWSPYSSEEIRQHRDARERRIYHGFVHNGRVPEYEQVFGAQAAANPPR